MLGSSQATIDLPLKIAIFSILGVASLGIALSQISNLGCLVPARIHAIPNTSYLRVPAALEISIYDSRGNPVPNADLVLRDESGVVWSGSARDGKAIALIPKASKGYLELIAIPRGCYSEYNNPRFVKILQ